MNGHHSNVVSDGVIRLSEGFTEVFLVGIMLVCSSGLGLWDFFKYLYRGTFTVLSFTHVCQNFKLYIISKINDT